MNPYFIFILVLTVFYVIYYVVNIAHDLYGKKGEVKDTVEEYDVCGMDADKEDDDDSISVTESENGFVIGEQAVETQVDVIDPATPEEEEVPVEDEATKQSRVAARMAETAAKMEDADVYLSDGMLDEELYQCLLAKGMTGKQGVRLEWTMTKDEL